MNKEDDPVAWPIHYNKGDIEAFDAARAASTSPAAFQEHCRLTAFGYVWRAPYKGTFEQDIKKAIWYLRQSIGDDPRVER